ncbi:signal peptidase I [Marinicellulosiphila megalodicopiae]|uniref:signal peptidase I n=1 Tax=Marinicellulosiphila megalodicopiae TaxID=2724896 RepID=UPI003BB03BA2
MTKKLKEILFEYKGFLVLILLMLIVRSSVMDWNPVPSTSMMPTIIEGDRVLIDKLAYDLRFPFFKWSLVHFKDPLRADIVVINSSQAKKRLIKRIIAIPGDEIWIKDNRVVINQSVLSAQLIRTDYDKLAGFEELLETNITQNGKNRSYVVRLYVNQEDISPLKNMKPLRVPEGFYFVMGDNRHLSDDSRLNLKLVPRNEIIGKAKSVVFSADYENYHLPRSDRWFVPLYLNNQDAVRKK